MYRLFCFTTYLVFFVVLIIFCLACDDEATTEEAIEIQRTGALGESCMATSDCAEDLVCIDLVCQTSGSRSSSTSSPSSTSGDSGVRSIAPNDSGSQPNQPTTIVTRGQEGESCRARQDCDSNLACINNVCTSAAATNTETTTGGQAGESCVSRSDCEIGLVCVNQVCSTADALLPAEEEDASVQTAIGKRGESCQTRIDCEPGLVCVNGSCQLSDYNIEPNNKECVLIQCRDDDDCCPAENYNCEQYDSLCQSNPQPNMYCDQYSLYCTCEGRECVDERCIHDPPCEDSGICNLFSSTRILCSDDNRCVECLIDDDCFGDEQCNDGECVECSDDDDCDDDETCEDNLCVAGCKSDLDCVYFFECQSGTCVEVGCQSDRECIAYTGNAFSICEDAECHEPCDTDLECSSAVNFEFRTCSDGYCVDVGCETDAECRLRLNIVPGYSNAVDVECREPEE